MPIPLVNYAPGAKFAFNRGYLKDIRMSTHAGTKTWDGHTFKVAVTAPVAYNTFWVFDTRIIAWSSNVYTLDFLLTDAYYVIPPNPTHFPFVVGVSWEYSEDPPTPFIRVTNAGDFSTHFLLSIPQAPSSYWAR